MENKYLFRNWKLRINVISITYACDKRKKIMEVGYGLDGE